LDGPRTGRQDVVLRGYDGVVWGSGRIWALDLDDLIAIAKRNVTRELTAEECRQYLGGLGCP
jgi:hypothetical protein